MKTEDKDMTVGEKMRRIREDRGLTMEDMAWAARCSAKLIGIIEEGGITHPNIARRIGWVYGLTPKEVKQLHPTPEQMKEFYRKLQATDF